MPKTEPYDQCIACAKPEKSLKRCKLLITRKRIRSEKKTVFAKKLKTKNVASAEGNEYFARKKASCADRFKRQKLPQATTVS